MPRFTYSGQNEDNLKSHSGQTVTIVRPLTADEADLAEVGPMSRIKFSDGYEADAFDDELAE